MIQKAFRKYFSRQKLLRQREAAAGRILVNLYILVPPAPPLFFIVYLRPRYHHHFHFKGITGFSPLHISTCPPSKVDLKSFQISSSKRSRGGSILSTGTFTAITSGWTTSGWHQSHRRQRYRQCYQHFHCGHFHLPRSLISGLNFVLWSGKERRLSLHKL